MNIRHTLSLSFPTLATSFAAMLIAPLAAAAPGTATVDFANGTAGWEGLPHHGQTGSWIETPLDSSSSYFRTVNPDTFFLNWSTTTNQAFLGDYTQSGTVTLGIDVLASTITFEGREVPRQMVVQLIDYDNPAGDAPYTSVWYDLGTIQAGTGWQHLSVTIGDTSSTTLPAGWGGDGATVGDGPGLPDGRTFADVLASVDEVRFTTAVPGYLYGYTYYDVSVDNISIAAVPEPSTYAMLLGGLGLMGAVARRRSRRAGSRLC